MLYILFYFYVIDNYISDPCTYVIPNDIVIYQWLALDLEQWISNNKIYNNVIQNNISSCQIRSIKLGGKTCVTLLVCGSVVTTIARSFYDKELSHLDLQRLSHLVNIKVAGGVDTLPLLCRSLGEVAVV